MNGTAFRRVLGAILVVGAISATTSVASAQYYSTVGPRDYMYSGRVLPSYPSVYGTTYYPYTGFYTPYGSYYSPYYSYSTYSPYPAAVYYAPSYYAPPYGYTTSYAPVYSGRVVGRGRRVW
jgi:hypothetical protein